MGVLGIDSRTSHQEHSGNVTVSLLGCTMERGPTVVVRRTRIRSSSQESPSVNKVTIESRIVQERATVFVHIGSWLSLWLLARHMFHRECDDAISPRAAQRQASAGAR